MSRFDEFELAGCRETLLVSRWNTENPRLVALLVHGYGEHSGRYAHVAERLVQADAVVYAADHLGHGRSGGERVLIETVDDLVSDLRSVRARAVSEHAGLPVVVIGHSLGSIVATRYAQMHPEELAALVISGAPMGGNPAIEGLLTMEPFPEVPIGPELLSRDPKVGAEYLADPLVWSGPFKRQTLAAMFSAINEINASPPLAGMSVLWLHGEDDQLAPAALTEPAMKRLAGDRLQARIYPGARHEVFNETNSDEVLDDVVSFIRSIG